MKNKFLSPSLLWEGFKQLKIIGIIGSVIMALAGIIAPLSKIIEVKQYVYYDESLYVSLSNYVQIGYLIFLCFVPIMMLVMFNFLSRRNACDFYHALPVKRNAMYLSFITAVFIWAVIMIAIISVLPLIVLNLGTGQYAISYNYYLDNILLLLAGTVLVMGGLSIGISLTGTLFTNILVSAMILCAPRLLLVILTAQVSDLFVFIPVTQTPLIVNSDCNAIFKALSSVFGYGSSSVSFTAAYSGILGVIYMAIGGLLFYKRKSEIASMPSINNVVQCVLRLIPAFIITSIATLGMVLITLFHNDDDMSTFYMFVLYIVGIVVYFLYELITTRKWKKVGRSALFLPILVALNIVFGLMVYIPANNLITYTPSAEEIESVQIEAFNYNQFDVNGINNLNLTDDSIKKIVAQAYSDQIAEFVQNNGYYYSDSYTNYLGTSPVEMTIRTRSGSIRRNVYLNNSQISSIFDAIKKSDDGDKLKYTIRECDDFDTLYMNENQGLSNKTVRELYNSLIKEINESDNPVTMILGDFNDTVDEISYYSGKRQYVTLRIGRNTPKTLALLMNKVNAQRTDFDVDELITFMDNVKENEYKRASINLNVWDDDTRYSSYYDVSQYENARVTELKDMLDQIDNSELTTDKIIVKVTYDMYSDYGQGEYTKFYNLTQDEADELMKVFEFDEAYYY